MGATGTGLLVDDRLCSPSCACGWRGGAAVIQSGATRAESPAIWSCARNLGDAGPTRRFAYRRREVVGGDECLNGSG